MNDLKVGIATLYHKNCNHGGLLQAYALQKILSRYAGSVELLTLDLPFSKTKLYANKLKHYSPKKTAEAIQRKSSTLRKTEKEKAAVAEHREAFAAFERSIPHSKLINKQDFVSKASEYDLLVAGSDQIWNPAVWEDCFFFADVNAVKSRKVSYAASMGCTTVSKSDELYLNRVLSDFFAVSLREQSGKNIVDKVCKQKSVVVLDPTLLITQKEWLDDFFKASAKRKKPYAFIYLVNKNKLHVEESISACKGAGLDCVVVPLDTRNFQKAAQYDNDDGVTFLTSCPPPVWVNLINGAQVVLTDSFHGIAFSSNFNRPFWCFSNTGLAASAKNPENRREYFLETIQLQNRILEPKRLITSEMISDPIDFSAVNSILQKRREDSMRFIDYCFEGIA